MEAGIIATTRTVAKSQVVQINKVQVHMYYSIFNHDKEGNYEFKFIFSL